MKNKTAEEVLKNEFGIGQNIDNDNIGFSVNGDTGNWKKIISAMEKYASQFKPVEVSIPSDSDIEKWSAKMATDELTGKFHEAPCHDLQVGARYIRDLWLSSQPQEDKWVSVEEKPLFTKDEKGYWTCTEAGEDEFLAAVPYEDSTKPGEELWWIRHCVIEDGTGLCVVGDDCNEPAGWQLESVTHYIPLPSPPKVADSEEKQNKAE